MALRLGFAIATGWGYRAIAVAANLINISLLFKFMDRELLGLWFLMLGAQSFMGLFDLGFGQTVQRRIAFAKASCGPDSDVAVDEATKRQIRGILNAGRRFYIADSGAVFVIVLIGGFLYFHTLQLSNESFLQLKWAWMVMALGYCVATWGSFVDATLNGLGEIGWSNVANSAAQVTTVIANALVLCLGLGIYGLAVVWLGKAILVRMMGLAIVRRRHVWAVKGSGSEDYSFSQMIGPSLRWWFAIFGYFLMVGVSQFLIAHFLGAGALPDYVAIYSAMSSIQGAMVCVVASGTPLFSQMIRAGELSTVRNTMINLSRYSLGGLALSYSWMILYGREVFDLWLGPGHYVGPSLVGVLGITMLLEAHQGMLQTACVAAERLGFYKLILLGGILSTTLSLFLIPHFGLLGSAISILLGQAVTQHWATPALALKVLNMRFIDDFRRILAPAFLLVLVVLGTGITIKFLVPDMWIGLLLNALGTVVGALVFCWKPIAGLAKGAEYFKRYLWKKAL